MGKPLNLSDFPFLRPKAQLFGRGANGTGLQWGGRTRHRKPPFTWLLAAEALLVSGFNEDFQQFWIRISSEAIHMFWRIESTSHRTMTGALEHDFYDFPFSWECHHPTDELTPSFFRGVGRSTTNQWSMMVHVMFPRVVILEGFDMAPRERKLEIRKGWASEIR